MSSPWTIAAGTAIAGGLRQAWKTWADRRNALPDDERAEIFWNDQRYERLRSWMIWSPVAIILLVLAFGLLLVMAK